MSQTVSPPLTRGIDLSHHNGPIDWQKVAASGIAFAFLKATEGVSYTDPTFAAHWKEARAAGILTGAYHFYRVGQSPTEQADHLLAALAKVGGMQGDDLPLVLDIEDAVGGARLGRAAVVRDAHAFLERIEQASAVPGRRRPILYTYPAFAADYLDATFSDYPLWIAHYGVPAPRIPAGWRTYLLWQVVAGEAGGWTVPGCADPVDGNLYRGTPEQLHAALCPETPTLVYINEKAVGPAWLNPSDETNYAPLRALLERLFTPAQVNTLLGFDAARRPVWNGRPLPSPTLYRLTGASGASQLWVQVRGFAAAFGLILDPSSAPGTLVLRRPGMGDRSNQNST